MPFDLGIILKWKSNKVIQTSNKIEKIRYF